MLLALLLDFQNELETTSVIVKVSKYSNALLRGLRTSQGQMGKF